MFPPTDSMPFSNRPTDNDDDSGGFSGPRIHIWTWQDTRDEFGDDDRGGFQWGGGGGGRGGGGGLWGKEGGILDGDDDDDDCGCHGLPADPGGGNDNWHSNSRIDGNEALVFGTEFSEIC